MLKYKFDSTTELMDFLLNTTEFLEWNVIICKFSTLNGLNIDMNTKISDASGTSSYIKFKLVYSTLKNFYDTITQNNYSDLNIQIKLELPLNLKNNFDPNNEYNNFYLNIYSDNITIMCSTSCLEKTIDSGLAPIVNYETYFSQLFAKFYNKYITNLK